MKTKSKDIPLAEITLRKYEKPVSKQGKRESMKKICLSVGLLQPGDSRDIIVDILHVLADAEKLTSDEIKRLVIKYRKKAKLPLLGIADSNIRRQLKRLRDLFLIEKIKNHYRVAENEDFINIFEEKIEKYYLKNIIERVKIHFNYIKR